ncbi:hypothetical protein J2TS4_50910 [Paenibacillus sp. J2TS4]|nr:hypothetical protein J2TS4_50910 [Paenibacillus sp. J2TS4]
MERLFGMRRMWLFSLLPVTLIGFILFSRIYDAGEWEPFRVVNDEVQALLNSDNSVLKEEGAAANSSVDPVVNEEGDSGSTDSGQISSDGETNDSHLQSPDNDGAKAPVQGQTGPPKDTPEGVTSSNEEGAASTIGRLEDAVSSQDEQQAALSSGKTLIDINTATVSELTTLPGIGPSKANAIANYRLEHKGFKSIEEIMEVKGIGQKTFDKFKDQIMVTLYSAD